MPETSPRPWPEGLGLPERVIRDRSRIYGPFVPSRPWDEDDPDEPPPAQAPDAKSPPRWSEGQAFRWESYRRL